MLAFFNNVAPGREAEFEEWFQHEHLQERLGVPGFLLGRRHEAVAGEPRYFNFYVTRSADVLKSDDYQMRVNNPTPTTRMVMSEIFKDMIRTVCHRTLRLGNMRGAVAVLLTSAIQIVWSNLTIRVCDDATISVCSSPALGRGELS